MALSQCKLITETKLLVGDAVPLLERVTKLQGDTGASTLSYSYSQFGWKMPHPLVVCLERVPNKTMSHTVSESFHTGGEMTMLHQGLNTFLFLSLFVPFLRIKAEHSGMSSDCASDDFKERRGM